MSPLLYLQPVITGNPWTAEIVPLGNFRQGGDSIQVRKMRGSLLYPQDVVSDLFPYLEELDPEDRLTLLLLLELLEGLL